MEIFIKLLVRLVQLILRTLESCLSGISVVHRQTVVTSKHHLNTPGNYSITCDMVYKEVLSRSAISLPDIVGAQL